MSPPNPTRAARPCYDEAMEAVCRRVAAKHGLSCADLVGSSLRRPILFARQEAMAACYDAGLGSWPEVGAHFGAREHTSALRGARQHRLRETSATRETEAAA